MPVSRGRKPTPKTPKPIPMPHQPQPQQKHQKTTWERIRDHPVFWILGLVAALLAVGEPVHQALIEPEISATGEPDVSSPFSVPFDIKNRSWLFDMREAQLNCVVAPIITTGHWEMMGFTIQSRTATIEADTPAAFRCLIGSGPGNAFGGAGNICSAHMFLFMTYHTLIFPRKSRQVEFTWYTDANPPRWIPGKILK
jgi:hypothetical protein